MIRHGTSNQGLKPWCTVHRGESLHHYLFILSKNLRDLLFIIGAPRGFGDLGGEMAIYFQGAREHCSTYLQGFGEKALSFGDLGSTKLS